MNKVPDSILVNTGEQEKVSGTIDQFFRETIDFAMQSGGRESDFNIKSGELSLGPNHIGDDRVSYLQFRDEVLACVLETRTQENYVLYTFFRKL